MSSKRSSTTDLTMPLYAYRCTDCQEGFEALHKADALLVRCGLHCRRRGSGAFGQGAVERLVSAANHISRGRAPLASAEQALERAGGPLTERDLDRARDGGMTVYRRSGASWQKDGGDDQLPTSLQRPGSGS